MMGAGTLGVPAAALGHELRRQPLGYEFPGTAYLMMALMAIGGLAADRSAGRSTFW